MKKLLNHIFIDGLSGMALGLFSTLIVGTIIQQIGNLIGGNIGDMLFIMGKMAAAMTGAGIGIQDGQTLKKAPGMTEYLMKGEMDMETAIKEGGVAGIGLQIFSIAISLIFMLGGVLMFVIKR